MGFYDFAVVSTVTQLIEPQTSRVSEVKNH